MGKYERKKSRKSGRKWLFPLVAAAGLLAVLGVFMLCAPSAPGESQIQTTDPKAELPVTESSLSGPAAEPAQTAPAVDTQPGVWGGETVEFPVQLAEGKLLVDSLFQFEGVNPDCENREGRTIAAVMIRNTSNEYLKSATILAIMGDGSHVVFSVSDLPAGREMLAFSVDNTLLADDYVCVAVEAEAVFGDPESPQGLSVSVDGMIVTVTNETQQEMTQIEFFCHGIFGESYYGGVTYLYTIEKLAPGESTAITVNECVLGMVEVVRVAVREGE